MTAIEILSSILVILGSLSIIVGLLGVYRMPDFFTRLHAASVFYTLGTILILFGLILYAGLNIVSIKLLLILIFILITTPTAAHALAKSALHGKLKPMTDDD